MNGNRPKAGVLTILLWPFKSLFGRTKGFEVRLDSYGGTQEPTLPRNYATLEPNMKVQEENRLRDKKIVKEEEITYFWATVALSFLEKAHERVAEEEVMQQLEGEIVRKLAKMDAWFESMERSKVDRSLERRADIHLYLSLFYKARRMITPKREIETETHWTQLQSTHLYRMQLAQSALYSGRRNQLFPHGETRDTLNCLEEQLTNINAKITEIDNELTALKITGKQSTSETTTRSRATETTFLEEDLVEERELAKHALHSLKASRLWMEGKIMEAKQEAEKSRKILEDTKSEAFSKTLDPENSLQRRYNQVGTEVQLQQTPPSLAPLLRKIESFQHDTKSISDEATSIIKDLKLRSRIDQQLTSIKWHAQEAVFLELEYERATLQNTLVSGAYRWVHYLGDLYGWGGTCVMSFQLHRLYERYKPEMTVSIAGSKEEKERQKICNKGIQIDIV